MRKALRGRGLRFGSLALGKSSAGCLRSGDTREARFESLTLSFAQTAELYVYQHNILEQRAAAELLDEWFQRFARTAFIQGVSVDGARRNGIGLLERDVREADGFGSDLTQFVQVSAQVELRCGFRRDGRFELVERLEPVEE